MWTKRPANHGVPERTIAMKRIVLTVALLLPVSLAVFAQPGSVPAKTGRASFTVGATPVEYGRVSGTFMQSAGYTVVTISFSKDGKPGGDHLGISLMIQKPGPVDLNQPMGNGIGYWTGGKIFAYEKGKSQCTMAVTKLTATSVEGTAECAVVNEQGGPGSSSLTNVKFFATAAVSGVN
jgi:hypothetical protein